MALDWDNIIITTDEYSYSLDAEQRMITFTGEPGGPGPQGPSGTITVGTTTTLPAGSNATVENVGTSTNAIFNFGIPRGASGGGGGGDTMWGEITGTLSDQTDLQNALNAKANTADLGSLADQDTVDYATEVTNKPTLGTMAAVNDAASDGKTYGRKNGAWAEVTGGGGGSTAWGDITGTLSNQTDLNTALSAKANSADLGTMSAVNDASSDGKTYGRKNGAWAEITGGGGGSVAWGSITGTLSDQTDLNTALSGKQAALTFDSTPTDGSSNPVTSDGIYDALAGKQGTLTFDTAPTASSTNPVTSGGVYTALGNKQNTLTFDASPTASSTNPVTSGGVYTALDGKQATLTFDSAPTASSTNPVTSGGVYTALGNKADTADLGDLASLDSIDYTTNKLTNKPTLGTIAAANYTISSTDLTDGTSPLTTGDLYFYYEA